MIKTIKTNQENVKLTIFSSTEDSGSDPNIWSTFYMIFLLTSSNSTGVK